MLKRLAVATSLALVPLIAASALADGTTTTTAGTLVVVTPSAPIVVQQGGPAPVAQPIQPPGAEEMPPPPPAPPQNEDWRNVSHINGNLVPVGEHNRYLYSYRKTNVMGNPFGLFFGYYDLSVSRGLSQNLALSVAATGWSFGGGDRTGLQLTASLPIYFRRTFSGPYLEPGLIYRASHDATVEYGAPAYDCVDCSDPESHSWAGPELLLGWHWTFDSGLNLAAAFGVAKHLNPSDGDDGADVNGYFRVGYAF